MSLPRGASRPRTHQAGPGWLLGPHSPCTLPPVSLKARGTGSVHGRQGPELEGPRTAPSGLPDVPPARPHITPHPIYTQDLITLSELAPPARAMLEGGGGPSVERTSSPAPSKLA